MPLLSFSCLFIIFRLISLSIDKPLLWNARTSFLAWVVQWLYMWLQEERFEIFMGLLSLMLLRFVTVFSLCSILCFCIKILIIADFGHISYLSREQRWLHWFICRRSYPIGHSISLALKKQYVNFILHCFCSPFW